jgi:tripartite-type tricarboxylate transporter receptor subunit TctC
MTDQQNTGRPAARAGELVRRVLALAAGIGFATLAAMPAAAAADYPSRSVTIIVPYPAGGGVDSMARIIAQKMQELFHQNFVVDNRGGAGGTIGTRAAIHAAPDGYTLLLGHTGTISINPSMYPNLHFDPRKDLTPVGLIASMPVALLAHPSFPAKTLPEVIALAKKDPGKLNIGTSAVGTGGYMCAELFKSEAGLGFTIIPYKGTAPVMNDLLGGHVPLAFGVLPPALGNLQAGKLRVIAVTTPKRFSLLPDVPTFSESGMKDFDGSLHYGLLAPAGTPPDIVEKLSAALRKLASDPAVQKQIRTDGGDPMISTAAEYATDIDKEEKKWGALVHKLNLMVH